MPIFHVTMERVESCEFTVEGPSKEAVEEAVENDEWGNYFFDESKEVTVTVVPAKFAEKTKPEAYVVYEADGTPEILDSAQFKLKYPLPEMIPEPPLPPDTLTLPLFPEEK